jgi:diacylglycerol kinase (ATP)
MTTVAVVAHAGKSVGGGLRELRSAFADAGVTDPLWFEVAKSKQAPKRVRNALDDGADLVVAWGGDGTVQRVAGELAGTGVPLGIVPAGTANLLASSLGIARDIRAAVETALHGEQRALDLGVMNGEHFAVMAGIGFDARMIRDTDRSMKDRFGRAAYVFTGAKHLRSEPVKAKIKVDGATWFKGPASCVLCGNVGDLFGGVTVFEDAVPDDGRLELGVVTATGAWQWVRTLSRTIVGQPQSSPFVDMTSAHSIEIRLERATPYELDGGDRRPTDRFEVSLDPGALVVCAPGDGD